MKYRSRAAWLQNDQLFHRNYPKEIESKTHGSSVKTETWREQSYSIVRGPSHADLWSKFNCSELFE